MKRYFIIKNTAILFILLTLAYMIGGIAAFISSIFQQNISIELIVLGFILSGVAILLLRYSIRKKMYTTVSFSHEGVEYKLFSHTEFVYWTEVTKIEISTARNGKKAIILCIAKDGMSKQEYMNYNPDIICEIKKYYKNKDSN